MVLLVIEFAAKKTDLPKLTDEILTTIRRRNIAVNASRSPEEAGILADVEWTGLFRYKWRLELLSEVDESTLEVLRKDFLSKEVHDIRLEGNA